jgi:hypothetical protein
MEAIVQMAEAVVCAVRDRGQVEWSISCRIASVTTWSVRPSSLAGV